MFSSRLRYLRKDLNLTQEELAKKLNISRSTINLYERGDRNPDPNMLINIANFFGCTVDYLLGRTDEKNLVLLEGDNLPEELKGKIDAIGIVEDAIDKGISPEAIKEILEIYNKHIKKASD